LIKNKKAYWWSLCDSGVALFNGRGKKTFFSPDGWVNFPKDWKEKKGEKKKIIARHRDYRNAVGEKGELTGYGVVDGEETAKLYLNIGTLDISAGDFILLYTDGFENYLNLKEFIELFVKWPENLENQFENVISEKSKESPKKYGREKTIIAVSI
jgi:serine/threonine protein phosphatase PrpC